MNWIKRNKFFVISIVVAMGLLGGAGYYDWQGWSNNAAAFDKLTEIHNTLQSLAQKQPSPGNDKVDNVKTAKDQADALNSWINESKKYFAPVTPIPPGRSLRAETFGNSLKQTIAEMQKDARDADVTLPPDYGFSFTAERNSMTFAPGSLEPLAAQLGEVKSIVDMLYAAHINTLDGVQRVRVSADDTSGPQTDYTDETPQQTDLAEITPYIITFRSFSAELAQVLAGFENSRHGFIVKGINVQQAGQNTDAAGASAAAMPGYGFPQPPQTPAAAGRGGLQTVLKEQLLRVTIEVEIVKLSSRN